MCNLLYLSKSSINLDNSTKAETFTNKSEFSACEAARFKDLYQQGACSLQQYENAEKQNELNRNGIVEKQSGIEFRQNLEVKNQILTSTIKLSCIIN